MTHTRSKWIKALLAPVAAIAISCAAATAFAQDASSNYNEDGEPTTAPKLEMARPLTSWGLSLVFLFGVLALAFKSSKRNAADR